MLFIVHGEKSEPKKEREKREIKCWEREAERRPESLQTRAKGRD